MQTPADPITPLSGPDYRPVILITGCGSGLGLALAHLFGQHPEYRVVITARGRSLEKLRGIFTESTSLMLHELDVTSGPSREKLIHEIERRWGGVDILINNAGISYRAVIEHMTDEDEILQLSTNYLGPMGLIRLVLPRMRERGRGKIINVSSVSGMLAMPTMGSYSASKYALEGASESLWYEMRPLGISVCLVQPGFIHSNSFEHVHYTEKSNPQTTGLGPYSDYYFYMGPFVKKLMKLSPISPEDIARRILKLVHTSNPPLWVPVTPDAYIFYYIRRLMPRRWLLPLLFYFLPKASRWGQGYTKKRPNFN